MRMGSQYLFIIALIAVSLVAPGPAPAADASRSQPPANGEVSGNYQIGPEDVLDIVVWNNAALSRTVPVRPDGMISLPLLNEIQAAGLTALQVRDILIAKLEDYMPTPEVSVIVKEVKSAKVSVIGEVKSPGRYEIKGRMTVLDVLAQAGPFSDFAARSRIFVLRANGSTTSRVPFNYNKAVSSRGEQENFMLQPGDIIVVP